MSSFLFFALRNDFCPVYALFQGLQFLIHLFKFQWIGTRNLNGCIYNYDSSFVVCSQLLDCGVTNTLQNLQVFWWVSKGTAVLCSQYCSIFSHHFVSSYIWHV